jgi:glutathione S-transferase
METPVLWQFTYSHFNEKARWALDSKAVPHLRRSLIPGFHIMKVMGMTGQTSVPVLILNGKTIFDSSRIIEALEEAYPQPSLYPDNADERRRALELEDFFDEELGPYIRRWAFHVALPYREGFASVYARHASLGTRLAYRAAFPALREVMKRTMSINAADAEIARKKTLEAMDRIDRELGASSYLVGDHFTVADLAAAALLSPLVMPPEFPYPLPLPLPEPISRMRESVSQHRAFKWTLQIYRLHRGQSAEVAAGL